MPASVKGVATGVAGVFLKPMAGMLDLLEGTTRGLKSVAGGERRLGRVRLPRAQCGPVLEPYDPPAHVLSGGVPAHVESDVDLQPFLCDTNDQNISSNVVWTQNQSAIPAKSCKPHQALESLLLSCMPFVGGKPLGLATVALGSISPHLIMIEWCFCFWFLGGGHLRRLRAARIATKEHG